MTAAKLLADLRAQGIRLAINGDRIHIDAPKGKLTPELRAVIVEHKAEILAILAAETTSTSIENASPPTPTPLPTACPSAAPVPWRTELPPALSSLATSPTCPACGLIMAPSTVVFPYGRGWYCVDHRRCGRVVWIPDTQLSCREGQTA